MNVFDLRDRLIRDYASFVSSFVNIRDPKIRKFVEDEFASGTLWPRNLYEIRANLKRETYSKSSIERQYVMLVNAE